MMPNFRRSSKHEIGGFRGSKSDGPCKKHPKHRQSPGVCSLCLKERLRQLSATSWSRATSTTTRSSCSTSSSLSSCYSLSSASSCSSPSLSYAYRFGMQGKTGSMSLVMSANNVLKKSRSLAFVPRMRRRDGGGGDKKKGRGFWSNLLLRPASNKRMEENDNTFMQSRTVRERTVVH
ncbi:hypothetical protein FNV43_RR11096 [Rhamnella rubrinervis]|uniref:Uncharacterized protein n=1 Tax=Rhamnella rubrinervis TaxID=2594499 RepID=A0A8K0H5H5_9ROSA|nr:hypothetical protein FNV43_RR11096 [Rhamnella rubrinervis]